MKGQWTQRSEAAEWIAVKLANPRGFDYSISVRPASSCSPTKPLVIGSMGVHGDNEVGYMFHPSSWGKGYATEALAAYLRAYFEKFPREELVVAKTDVTNAGSRKVAEKVGFVEVRREVFDNPTLGTQDTVVYELKKGNLPISIDAKHETFRA
jgi:RimJ/RimL family protein N-acetyltransferase